MFEWGITPEYIDANWTDEILYLMVTARTERLKRYQPQTPTEPRTTPSKRLISANDLFEKMNIKVEKR